MEIQGLCQHISRLYNLLFLWLFCLANFFNFFVQETTLLEDGPKEPIFITRQKMCNIVRSMQQQHIAELFPILDSRETTEGSEELVICRICHTAGEETLVAPCRCKGSTQFVHETCLLTWFKKSVKNHCELCQENVPIRKKNRPLSQVNSFIYHISPMNWSTLFIECLGKETGIWLLPVHSW